MTVIAPVIAPIVQSAVAVVAEPDGDDDGTGGGHGTDESGGAASQPTGGPQGGTAVTTAQGLLPNPAHNGAVLPQTGLDAGLLAWSLAGLLLLVAGLLLLGGPVRRTRPGR